MLAGKRVLLTGASGGIGSATAELLAKEGAELLLTYLSEPESKLHELTTKCREQGAKDVSLFRLDITANEDITQVSEEIRRRYRQIDILINMAGVITWKSFHEQTFTEIERQVAVNLTGLMKLTKAVLPMINDAIINIGSSAGKRGDADHVPYCATKFAVRGFTQALAKEHLGLRIYCVNPDVTATEMSNFEGRSPQAVAEVIVQTVKDGYGRLSGSDIDVWEIIKS